MDTGTASTGNTSEISIGVDEADSTFIVNDVMLIDFILFDVLITISLPIDDDVNAANIRSTSNSQSKYMKTWKQNSRSYVCCKVCVKFPDIVKRFTSSANHKCPSITLSTGTRFRPKIVEAHLKTQYHLECVKAERISQIQPSDISEQPPLDLMISKANEKQANLIGKFAYSIYNDAKRLTLAAWNWPSRIISFELGRLFEFNKNADDTSADNINKMNLQYINPKSHSEILECIVDANAGVITAKMEKCVALSLRVDGSVDRTNIDKIYILAKLVNENGNLETIFLGVGQQTDRGVNGLFKTVKETISSHGANSYEIMLKKLSSVVTDGATDNRYGLWGIMEEEVKSTGSELTILKIWCAAHRSELAWKSVSRAVPELKEIFENLVSITTHFHTSAMRQAELKKVADENNLNLKHLPRLHTVRWTEFSYGLLDSFLFSWRAIVIYCQTYAGRGYLQFATNYKLLKLVAFVADLLNVYSRFQKKLQSDDLHIISMHKIVNAMTADLQQLKTECLLGGWESTLKVAVVIKNCEGDEYEEEAVMLENIELDTDERERRGAHNKKRDYEKIRSEIIDHLSNFIEKRFEIDNELIEVASPFIKLDIINTNVAKMHELISPDLDVTALYLQFRELCGVEKLKQMNLQGLVSHLKNSTHASSYTEVLTVLARILAATPHSADCERVISANNLLKTAIRNSFNIETENRYLHVHFNMPPVFEWQPRDAVVKWIMKKERRHHNLAIENDEHQAKEQSHFQGVFRQADESHKKKNIENEDDTENHISVSSKNNSKRRCF